MAHEVCNDINEWITENVWQPVESWVGRYVEKCQEQDCDWWCACCNKWFCWLAWVVEKVIEWVLVPITKLVVHTVCEIVADVIDLIVNVFVGLWDIVVGIFTWDWARVWDGLVQLVGGVITFVVDIFRIATFGDAIGFLSDWVSQERLRSYVRDKLKEKYRGDELQAIKDALGVDYGEFGFRIATRAIRTFVRSDFRLPGSDVPELIRWHENAGLRLNLKELCGYDYEEFWRRFRPEVVGDNGDVSESDVDDYINSRGASGPTFSIFCMDEGTLGTKISTASEKARALGLLFRWRKETIQVTRPEHVRQKGFDQNGVTALVGFLNTVIGRRLKSVDPAGATADLCNVPTVGVFRYTDKLNGLTVNLQQGACDGLTPNDDSGLTFMDRLPDIVWKYVQVHEMGHYFGLCHVDGVNRIMFTAAADENKSAWDWWLIPDYLYLHGGPVFVFEEATQVWDYIIANFTADCLRTRAK
jgi:hypothetical protein